MAGFTKEVIIQTLVELLNEKPMGKITVKDIVERCGVNRNTFYYHFKDIPDVMEFAVKRELDKIIESHMEIEEVVEGLLLIVNRLSENRRAMLHIYRSINREVFIKYLDHISEYVIRQYADNSETAAMLSEEDRELLIRFHKCIFVGVLLDWMEQGMNYDLGEFTCRLKGLYGDCTEDMLKRAVEKKG